MGNALDAVGQWLTQLSVLGQVAVLLALLLPLGGLAAFLLIGLIDFVGGRIRSRRLRRSGVGVGTYQGTVPGEKSEATLESGEPGSAQSGDNQLRETRRKTQSRKKAATRLHNTQPRRKITLKGMDENA